MAGLELPAGMVPREKGREAFGGIEIEGRNDEGSKEDFDEDEERKREDEEDNEVTLAPSQAREKPVFIFRGQKRAGAEMVNLAEKVGVDASIGVAETVGVAAINITPR